MSEFSRGYDAAALPTTAQQITASAEECRALARRFGLVAVKSLAATLTLTRDGPAVRARGKLSAKIVQSCAVSGENVGAFGRKMRFRIDTSLVSA